MQNMNYSTLCQPSGTSDEILSPNFMNKKESKEYYSWWEIDFMRKDLTVLSEKFQTMQTIPFCD